MAGAARLTLGPPSAASALFLESCDGCHCSLLSQVYPVFCMSTMDPIPAARPPFSEIGEKPFLAIVILIERETCTVYDPGPAKFFL